MKNLFTKTNLQKAGKLSLKATAAMTTFGTVSGFMIGMADGVSQGLTGRHLEGGALVAASVPAVVAGGAAGVLAYDYADKAIATLDEKYADEEIDEISEDGDTFKEEATDKESEKEGDADYLNGIIP